MTLRYWFICMTIVMALQGCIFVPTPQHHLLAGRGMIDSDEIKDIEISIATREDILLWLGESDLTINQQSIFA